MSNAAERERAYDRARKMAQRRAAGVVPRDVYEGNSLSALKPWEAHGVSRRTWERWRLKTPARNP